MHHDAVPGAGFEPAPPCGEWILSPPCLPFHHPGGTDQRNLGAMLAKRLRRLFTLGVLAAAVAAFRGWKLNAEEKKFNR